MRRSVPLPRRTLLARMKQLFGIDQANGEKCLRYPLIAFGDLSRDAPGLPADPELTPVADELAATGALKAADAVELVADAQARGKEMLVGCDSDVGGGSSAKVQYMLEGQRGFARFSGNLFTAPGRTLDKSGYAALVWKGTLDLKLFTSAVLCVRSFDRREYKLNITAASQATNHAIYQLPFVAQKVGEWCSVEVRFREMTKFVQGRESALQSPLPNDQILGIGILLADETDGPFELDLHSISATRGRFQ
mmetsp:Transcript_5143/g.13820  ORF Transcript_5143/g.13820 Transcript_5143/m.13820 type:complete len:250 (-) Transcript_5143:1017-1766(-)